jgi:hypothetical protein
MITPLQQRETAIKLLESNLVEDYIEHITRQGHKEETLESIYALHQFILYLKKFIGKTSLTQKSS